MKNKTKSPRKCIDVKDKHVPSSFVRRQSCEIYKLFPKSSSKAVGVLKEFGKDFINHHGKEVTCRKHWDKSD